MIHTLKIRLWKVKQKHFHLMVAFFICFVYVRLKSLQGNGKLTVFVSKVNIFHYKFFRYFVNLHRNQVVIHKKREQKNWFIHIEISEYKMQFWYNKIHRDKSQIQLLILMVWYKLDAIFLFEFLFSFSIWIKWKFKIFCRFFPHKKVYWHIRCSKIEILNFYSIKNAVSRCERD